METCPLGTYLVANLSECVPCHEHCSAEVGCAGPLPYLDRENGCIDCTLVQLTRSGSQVFLIIYSNNNYLLHVHMQDMCVSDTCDRGYYRDVLSPEHVDVSIVGDLMFGHDVCVPCDELCELCVGPGSRIDPLNACQTCSSASQLEEAQCVAECNATREFTIIIPAV